MMEYFYAGAMSVAVLYNLYKIRKNNYKVVYKDVIVLTSYMTFVAIVVIDDINSNTVLSFLATIGVSFMVAAFGLAIAESVVLIRTKKNPELDHVAMSDRSVRWIIVAVVVVYIANIVYDTYIQDGGTRVDLILADTLGLCLALFCLEKVRQQLRVIDTAIAAESI